MKDAKNLTQGKSEENLFTIKSLKGYIIVLALVPLLLVLFLTINNLYLLTSKREATQVTLNSLHLIKNLTVLSNAISKEQFTRESELPKQRKISQFELTNKAIAKVKESLKNFKAPNEVIFIYQNLLDKLEREREGTLPNEALDEEIVRQVIATPRLLFSTLPYANSIDSNQINFQSFINTARLKENIYLEGMTLIKASKDNKIGNEEYQKLTMIISAQKEDVARITENTSKDFRNYFSKLMKTPTFQATQKLHETILSKQLENELVTEMGYLGFIHHFKNYVLRSDQKYLEGTRNSYAKVLQIIEKLKKENSSTQQLEIIENTINEYAQKLDQIKILRARGLSAEQIDKRVRVDDAPANQALIRIKQGLNLTDAIEGWKQNWLDQMDILHQAKLYPISQIQERLSHQEQESFTQIVIFILAFILIIITTIFAAFSLYLKISRKIRHDFNELVAAKEMIEEKNNRLKLNLDSQRDQNDLMNLMMRSRNTEDLANNILTKLGTILKDTISVFYVIDGKNLKVKAAHGVSATSLPNQKVGEGLSGRAALEESIQHINLIDDIHHINILGSRLTLTSAIAAPIIYNDQVLGVMEFGFYSEPKEIELSFISSITPMIASQLLTLERHEEVIGQRKVLQEQKYELQQANTSLEENTKELILQQTQLERLNIELEASKRSLELKARELTKANKTKSIFLANVSHELRTPLNSIIILSKMLTRAAGKVMGEKEVKNATVINNAGEDLLGLINDILDLSKIEAGHVTLSSEEINLESLCSSIDDLFVYIAKEKGISWELKMRPEAPKSIVTDKGKLEQIIKNMISNALKFTHEGSVKLEIGLDQVNSVYFAVEDTGVGIPPSKHSKIFEAFEQSDQNISRDYGGTGLGLTISKNLAIMMGGDLILEKSEVGRGSRFVLSLPGTKSKIAMVIGIEDSLKSEIQKSISTKGWKLTELAVHNLEYVSDGILITDKDHAHSVMAQSEHLRKVIIITDREGVSELDVLTKNKPHVEVILWSDKIAERLTTELELAFEGKIKGQTETTIQATSDNQELKAIRGKAILVVDDDDRNIYALSQVLETLDLTVYTASNGEESINFLRNHNVDLVFMDIMMPVMDGLKAISYIRNDMKMVELPIIALTAKAMPEDRLQCLEVGASDYISKPLDINLVQAALIKWLIHGDKEINQRVH